MKIVLLIILLLVPCFVFAADKYDTKHCKDPEQLRIWSRMLNDNPESDAVDAIHALWVGLCIKVGAKEITTNRANGIFEQFRNSLLDAARETGKEVAPSSI